jgi:FAD/FMN-containing dehydrogenase
VDGIDRVHRPTRRQVLSGATAITGAAILTACSGPSPTARRRLAAPISSARPRSGASAPTAADWRALSRQVGGEVIRPGDPGYAQAHQLYDPRFDAIRPVGVVSAASPDDVSQAVAFAAHHRLPLALRSGGHSYLGASTGRGLVVDMRPMTGITLSEGSQTARLESGVRLIDAYAQLAAAEVSIPAGSCPTVGVTGLALGGGVGVVTRLHGLTCDRLASAEVVTATGEQVHADATINSDLFWALRGGGGSFAAVTAMTFRTHATSGLAVFTVSWPWSVAGRVLTAWQPWATDVPHELWSTCHLLSTSDPTEPPTVSVSGVWVGASAGATPWLDRLVTEVGDQPGGRYLADRDYLDTMLLEAGCDHESVEACHLAGTSAAATVARTTFVAASDLFDDLIPAAGVAAVVAAVEQRQQAGLGVGGVAFDSLGGAVSQVAADATAFAPVGPVRCPVERLLAGERPGRTAGQRDLAQPPAGVSPPQCSRGLRQLPDRGPVASTAGLLGHQPAAAA